MKTWHKWAIGSVVAAALGTPMFLMQPTTAKGKIPKAVFEAMTFPNGIPKGGPDGVLRHEWWFRTKDGTMIAKPCHDISGHDFSRADDATRARWIIDEQESDAADAKLMACGGPSESPFRFTADALAQPHCGEDCGGGCSTVGCPGTSHVGDGCELGGNSCVVTITCCPGPCLCQ